MTVYYIEDKMYFKDINDIESQIPDAGDRPRLFETYDRALEHANFMMKIKVDSYKYRITIDDANYPEKDETLLFGTQLMSFDDRVRIEMRIYRVSVL